MYSSVRTLMSRSASCSMRIGVSPMTMRYATPDSRRSCRSTSSGRYVPSTASWIHSSPCGHRPAPRQYGRCEWSAKTNVPTPGILCQRGRRGFRPRRSDVVRKLFRDRAARVNTAADRAGVTRVLQRAQVRADAAGVIAGVVKWYLRLIVILMAADAVKLTAVSTIVNQILAFVPNLLVAVLILAAFSWLASLARNLVTAALEPTMPNAKTIGVLAYGATFGFGVLAAATQIGVAATLLNILFIGIVGGLALAFGLAFGLGGRDEAARMWREMNGAVGNVVKEGAPAAGNGSGNGRPVERTEHAIRT